MHERGMDGANEHCLQHLSAPHWERGGVVGAAGEGGGLWAHTTDAVMDAKWSEGAQGGSDGGSFEYEAEEVRFGRAQDYSYDANGYGADRGGRMSPLVVHAEGGWAYRDHGAPDDLGSFQLP
jgi:hypothetical protein